MSKEAYYFSHDANARHDPKILAMRSEYGIQGYGIYWLIVEMLREADEFKLPKKQYVFNAIAMQMQCKRDANIDANYAKSFVEFCIKECDLFDENERFFWSNSLLNRMEKKKDLSEKRREAAKARWEKTNDTNIVEKKDDANAMQNNANAMQSDASKGKEKKEKKEIYNTNVALTKKEYESLIEKFGLESTKERIERLSLYKGSTGKKYKSDYMTILSWAKKEDLKVNVATHGKNNGIDWDNV